MAFQHCTVQRRVASEVGGRHVGAGVEQRGGRVDVSGPRGDVKWCVLRDVTRIDEVRFTFDEGLRQLSVTHEGALVERRVAGHVDAEGRDAIIEQTQRRIDRACLGSFQQELR